MKKLILALLSVAIVLLRANSPEPDQCLSPYFLIKGAVGENAVQPLAENLPLKSTSVKTSIAGFIADVTVTQLYANTGDIPIEAIYVFPGSTRAAVHGLTLQVGERRIVAQIKKRAEARQTYEAAKSAGKTATLLTQERPNVFQMNVANILPGDAVQVELRYTELLVAEDGVYAFVYPGVVGPRYAPANAATLPIASDAAVLPPRASESDEAKPAFTFDLSLTPGLPIQDATCPTHPVLIERSDARTLQLTLSPEAPCPDNRDFIFKYRLSGTTVQPGLIVSQGAEENFFLLQLQPPARPDPAQTPQRDYLFIIDISGSMHGFPLDTARRLMTDLLSLLRPDDTFNVLLFAGSNRVFAPASVPATPTNITNALDLLDRHQGDGSTELLPALRAALAMPVTSPKTSRTIALLTDGYISLEAEAFEVVRQNLNRANLFAFGIGASVNRHLIEGLARAGQGEPFIVTNDADAAREAVRFRNMVLNPVLTHMEISFDQFDAYDVEPVLQPDLLAQRPLIAFGKWRGPLTGNIVIEGLSGPSIYKASIPVSSAQPLASNSTLALLWARTRIAELADYINLKHDDARIAQVTDLGLRYNLLTKYTSFVAVDQTIRRTATESKSVNQPLPSPAGVSASTDGQQIPTSPEPGTYALLITAATTALIVFLRQRRSASPAPSP